MPYIQKCCLSYHRVNKIIIGQVNQQPALVYAASHLPYREFDSIGPSWLNHIWTQTQQSTCSDARWYAAAASWTRSRVVLSRVIHVSQHDRCTSHAFQSRSMEQRRPQLCRRSIHEQKPARQDNGDLLVVTALNVTLCILMVWSLLCRTWINND